MSFDNIQLPHLVIADLYKQSLVVLDEVQLKGEKLTDKRSGHPPATLTVTSDKIETEIQKSIPSQPLQIPEPEVAKPVINYLGGFKQQVSIIVSEPFHEHIQPDDLIFLEKMMTACKITTDDMAIINIANQPAAAQLWQLMPAKAVLLFDVSTSSVGIPFYQPDFKVQNWSGAKFLNAPALSVFRGKETSELKTLKRELWEALQRIFFEK